MYKTEFFAEDEFRCLCGNCNMSYKDMDENLLLMLDKLRANLKKPVRITSAIRCHQHNLAIGGAEGSTHLLGKGVDIHAPTSSDKFEIVEAAFLLGFTRIGIGKNFIHLDVASEKDNYAEKVLWLY